MEGFENIVLDGQATKEIDESLERAILLANNLCLYKQGICIVAPSYNFQNFINNREKLENISLLLLKDAITIILEK